MTASATFSLEETGERIAELLDASDGRYTVLPGGTGYSFPGAGRPDPVDLLLPRICLHSAGGAPPPAYWLSRPIVELVPPHAVVLIQAGASAAALYRGAVAELHRVIRRYVVRGTGRAQPLHRKTKGKSRYGSRLRLREARAQLVETNELLASWWRRSAFPPAVHLSCPVRLLADLARTEPPPPFDRRAALRIPHHVYRPSREEIERIHFLLSRGRIASQDPQAAAGGPRGRPSGARQT